MKKIVAGLTVSVALIAGLTGCASAYETPEKDESGTAQAPVNSNYTPDTTVFEQELPDGRTVLCIWATGTRKGGLSCDWESAAQIER